MRRFLLSLSVLSLLPAVPARAQSQVLCPQIYKPVCGLTSAHIITTYSNSCEAGRAGATILHDGPCEGAGEARCPHIAINPVCARGVKTGKEKTYDNICWAEKDWAALMHAGACH
jgi:hypothetical protein